MSASNVYDDAHKLVKSLKESEEFKEFVRLENEISKVANLKEEIKEFQSMQMELQTMQLMGKPLDETLMATAQAKLDSLNENAIALDYFKAEMRLNQLFADISKIIGDAMSFLNE